MGLEQGASLLSEPAPKAGRVWPDLWLRFRNRLLGDPGFQRWAARFPLTRPVARKRVRDLFDLVAGFVYSQTLSACVTAELFEKLAHGPRTVLSLAPELRMSVDAAKKLLLAAAALDLLQDLKDGRFALGPLGAALRGNPSVSRMIAHHKMLYDDLRDPLALLRGELAQPSLSQFWTYATASDPTQAQAPMVADYSQLMAESQALVADEILDAYGMRGHRRLLDVGGGAGMFLSKAAARHPDLSLMLFDLPAVTELARARFEALGLAARASLHPGSFHKADLPQGADIVSLVRVVHDHDDAMIPALLAKIHRALPDQGVLLVAEPMADTPGARPIGDAYFGFYLTAMGSGRPRTARELTALLKAAGFASVREHATHTPLLVRVLVARKQP